MMHFEQRPAPGRGWGCSPRVVRMHAFGVAGRSGAGRDARATAGSKIEIYVPAEACSKSAICVVRQ